MIVGLLQIFLQIHCVQISEVTGKDPLASLALDNAYVHNATVRKTLEEMNS